MEAFTFANQHFAMMKYLNNEYRTRSLDGNLESQLKRMISREVPDFARLSALMQDQYEAINCNDALPTFIELIRLKNNV